jgi:hypothetical protein
VSEPHLRRRTYLHDARSFFTLVCACKRYMRFGSSRRGACVVFRFVVVVLLLLIGSTDFDVHISNNFCVIFV